jgi:hypothetical protein
VRSKLVSAAVTLPIEFVSSLETGLMHASHRLAVILRDTLRRVELSADIGPDDPSLVELKRTLLLKIDALEAEAARSEAGTDHPHRAA